MHTRFFHCFVPVISLAILSAVLTNSTATPPDSASVESVPNQGYCTVEEAKTINDRGLANLYNRNPSQSCADFLTAIDSGICPATLDSQRPPSPPKIVQESNQGYCTKEEAQAINDRGLANLYHKDQSQPCADFLAAVDSGKCPGTIVSQSPPVVSKGIPPVSQETIYYVRDQFRSYDVYDPYDWELYYAGLEPDLYDQELVIAILVLQRYGIFNVFPGELFAFVNDRAHFRNHIRNIRDRMGRMGDRPDAHGNRPLNLAKFGPQQGQAVNPNAMRNTINNIKSANPTLWSGKRAQAGKAVQPGLGVQPNVGKGPMISPKPSITRGVFKGPRRNDEPGYQPYEGKGPKFGPTPYTTPGIVRPNLKGPRGPYGPGYQPYGGKGPKFGPPPQVTIVLPNFKGPKAPPGRVPILNKPIPQRIPGPVIGPKDPVPLRPPVPVIRPNNPVPLTPPGPVLKPLSPAQPTGPAINPKVIRQVPTGPTVNPNQPPPQNQLGPNFVPKKTFTPPKGPRFPAVRPQSAPQGGGGGGPKN